MLKAAAQSITIKGAISIGDKEAVEIYRTINADGSFGSSAQSIIDSELYAANMEECRKNRGEFEQKCLDIQDRLIDGSLLDEHLEDKEE